MPLQGKKLPQAATYRINQNQKGQRACPFWFDPFGSPRSSCAVRMEPLEGMGFLTESGSIRTVQRDLCYKLDIT
jgi:hypothetical protein